MAGASKRSSIGKLDFPAPNQQTPLLPKSQVQEAPACEQRSPEPTRAGHSFEDVAEGILAQDREAIRRETIRYVSFFWAIVCCLCCGSITAFSLYAPLFQTHLGYSQAMINTVSIVAELSMYLPVPLFGFLVDRYGPRPLALLASVAFGAGYFLAALAYRSHDHRKPNADEWPFSVMVVAFVGIGLGTSCMYLAAVTTCAKNFGRGKHKGLALAMPIASFGLSGMWQSQIGSRLLFVRNRDGTRGGVDVYRYFLFLGGILLSVGLVGTMLLRIVDESAIIDEAFEQLERSGLLEDSDFFVSHSVEQGYGTMNDEERRPSTAERHEREAMALHKQEQRRKKSWLLNEETRRFLADPTMWWLAGGFFLVSGPGEAFINNLGTIIGTLTAADATASSTSPATHVSIVAVASTVARIISGTLSDLLAPNSVSHQHRQGPDSLTSLASLDPLPNSSLPLSQSRHQLVISRMTLLLVFTLLLSLGQALLASGLIQDHASTRFWIVSAFIGTGYGAIFSLVPIVISCVWGIENFGTNWGIVATAPAGGAAVWGAVYAAVYQGASASRRFGGDAENSGRGSEGCHVVQCYSPTFWAMAGASWVACLMWLWAWTGSGGWRKRGIAV